MHKFELQSEKMPSGASWSGTTFPSHGNQRPGDLNSSRARSRWDTERAIKASNYNGLVTKLAKDLPIPPYTDCKQAEPCFCKSHCQSIKALYLSPKV